MNKQLSSLGVALAVALVSLLTGCQLYFGDSSSGGRPGSGSNEGGRPGSGSNGGSPGFGCASDTQCAAGCFCSNGVCEEGGFCASDKDCGEAFHCDTSRSSCIPDPACSKNDQCAPGSVCDAVTGKGCVATCACASDGEAIKAGFGWCDEARGTCMTGKDPAGACTGNITCSTASPPCPEGQVPLLKDGCFTGACRAIAACEAAPACTELQHLNDCSARTADCTVIKTGHNCSPGCGTPGGVCSCESYTFAGCGKNETGTIPLTIIPES